MFTTEKIARVSVINDLATDNRVLKTCHTLVEQGYNVVLTGRKLPNSLPLPNWPFKAERMNLLFKKGPLFYLFFNLRLFIKLLFAKAHLLYANDLDTLLPNYLVARLRRIPIIYDSHELFCDVPELLHAPFKRRVWQALEAWIVPRLNHCITVNESIASIFEKRYQTKFAVVRNISEKIEMADPKSKKELSLPENKSILLLQGAGINVDRGAEELIAAMKFVNNAVLLIIGSGDVWSALEKQVKAERLENKVRLIYKLPKKELMQYTAHADLGLSIDKNTNLNYYYSLPNKVFDYIQASVPILASRLPEIEKIVAGFTIGDFIPDHSPESIAEKINDLLSSGKLTQYKANTRIAAENLSWQRERDKLIGVIKAAGGRDSE